MAYYKFKCTVCKKKTELDMPMKDYSRSKAYLCTKCSAPMDRIYTAPRIRTKSSPNRY